MDNAAEVGYFAHGRDNPVADRTFQTQWISNHEDLLAFVRQRARELKRTRTFRRQFDTQQRQVGFFVNGQRAGDRIGPAFAFECVNLNPMRATNNVHVGDDFAGPNKESAAANQRLSFRVVS